MGQPGRHAAEQVEQDEPPGAETVLDRGTENPECPHVEDEVQPPPVQEHIRQEGSPIKGGDKTELPEEARWHKRELEQEPIQQALGQADLVEEREDVHP